MRPKSVRPKSLRKDLAAKDLKPGLRFRYQGADVEILRAREGAKDRFGQALDRWWSRNLDTGQEGYVSLGPTGKLYNVELLSTVPPAKSLHHATKKSPGQLDREIAEALAQAPGMTADQIAHYRSGRKWGWPADLAFKAATGRPLSRTPGRRSHATAAKRASHATRARAAKERDKASDKITIDQLAKLLGLPDWDSVDERNQHHYWEMSRGAEDEDAQMEAEQAAQTEVYNRWYDAVESVADNLLGEHGLELLAMKHTRKLHQNYRPHVLKIIPTSSWSDAADKIRETINGVGDFHFGSLQEFLDSGPYTARQAVLSHLGYVKRYPHVYGGLGANQMYEQAWR